MHGYEKLMYAFVIGVFLTIGVSIAIAVISYNADIKVTQYEKETFSSITPNTTNREIIEKIQDRCEYTPWYITQNDCERILIDKFVIPAK